jgi:hypothetical protein
MHCEESCMREVGDERGSEQDGNDVEEGSREEEG